MGESYTSGGSETADGTVRLDTMQAETGWWMFKKLGVKAI